MADTLILMDKGKIHRRHRRRGNLQKPHQYLYRPVYRYSALNIIKQPGENSMGFRPEDAVLGTSPSHGGFSHRVSNTHPGNARIRGAVYADLAGSHIGKSEMPQKLQTGMRVSYSFMYGQRIFTFSTRRASASGKKKKKLVAECQESGGGHEPCLIGASKAKHSQYL